MIPKGSRTAGVMYFREASQVGRGQISRGKMGIPSKENSMSKSTGIGRAGMPRGCSTLIKVFVSKSGWIQEQYSRMWIKV